MENNRISFLFGAGISLNDIPNSRNIDEKIHEDCLKWNYDNGMFFVDNSKLKKAKIKGKEYNITELLSYYKEILKLLFDTRRKFDNKDENYETIISYLKDLEIALRFNRKPFIKEYFKNKFEKNRLLEFFNESHIRLIKNYIESVILNILNDNLNTDNLNHLVKILKNEKKWNVFTLNHDLILENKLKDNKISFKDGFYDNFQSNGIQYQKWDFIKFDQSIFGTNNILKLHGSLNWHTFFRKTDKENAITLGYIKTKDIIIKPISIEHNGININLALPLFLSGIDNKFESYNYGLFLKQQYLFFKLLLKTDILICSGYSFGDYAINLKLIDWIVNNEKAKIVIYNIDNYPKLVSRAKGVMKDRLNDWKDKKIFHIEKGINAIDINEISRKIHKPLH